MERVPEIQFDPAKAQRVSYDSGNSWIEQGVTYYLFRGLSVCNVDGTLIDNITAPRLKVFVAPSICWQSDKSNAATTLRDPKGLGVPAPAGWRFPGFNKLGIVCFKMPDRFLNVHSIVPNSDIFIEAQNEFIYFNVNDEMTNYAKHAGYYDVLIARALS